jgi:hypothetical protein
MMVSSKVEERVPVREEWEIHLDKFAYRLHSFYGFSEQEIAGQLRL